MRKEARTFIDDPGDPRWGAKFLGALLAIPVAGVLGLPLLLLLLLLCWGNPGNVSTCIGKWPFFRHVPGFRSGKRASMAAASVIYLLPFSLFGLLVVSVDAMILGLWP